MTWDPKAGLCAACAHSQRVPHPRGGGDYWLCRMAEADKTMPRYPRLPVVRCEAFTRGTPQSSEGAATDESR